MVSSRLVQQLSSGKSSLDSVVLSKGRGENWPPVLLTVWLIDVLPFSVGDTVWSPAAPPAPPGQWQEMTLLLSHASLVLAV